MKFRTPSLVSLPAGKALLGISGGRDSVALLHLLLAVGRRDLVLCHLNHHLRGRESDEDAQFVRDLALRHDLPCEMGRSDVKALAKRRKLSLETAAREARHAFFKRMSRKHGTADVLLAHHAEDQAETILGNICRGCGLDGLSGMSSKTRLDNGLVLWRPLLQTPRAEIDAFVKRHRIAYREDSSNASLEHRRNRFRHEALPLLSEIAGRDVVPLLNRLGMMAFRDEDWLHEQACDHLREHLGEDRSLLLKPSLLALHDALLSRVIAIWLGVIHGMDGIGSAVIEKASEMLCPGGPAKVNLPRGRHLRRKAKRLWVEDE